MAPPPVQKVFAYLTRSRCREVLVFWDRSGGDAGPQLPGGTVDPGESLPDAVIREVAEESGIVLNHLPRYLGMDAVCVEGELHHRHYFHQDLAPAPADVWRHRVTAGEDDGGHLFEFRWLRLEAAMAELLGGQQALLGRIGFPAGDMRPEKERNAV